MVSIVMFLLMQHKIWSCSVANKNVWAKYCKRYRKQWENDPLLRGLCLICCVQLPLVGTLIIFFCLCAVATDNSLFYFLGVHANSVVLIFEQWALYANIVPVTLFS